MTPRILFNDKNLNRTDNDLLSLIISLALNSNYCYANNKYLAIYIDTSIRTISDSLSKLKKLGYVIVKYENNNRRIYLNTEKIPTKVATEVANNRSQRVAESCYHNINNKYKNKYNKFKNNDNKSKEELKELFNKKLLNIILKLENQELGLNN